MKRVVEVPGDGNYEWRGMQGPSSPSNFKALRKPSPFLFSRGVVIWRLEAMGDQRRKREKRIILTRNNPFDFDGDLKTNENEVRERMNELKTKTF